MIPCINKEKSWDFFDEACQVLLGIFGSIMILFTDPSHYFQLRMAIGKGSNNREKLYSLQLLLKTSHVKGLNQLWVVGESNRVIEWANQNYSIQK